MPITLSDLRIEDADPAMFEIAAFDCNDDDLNEFLKEERRFH
jgi:hypothetical protein